MAKANVTACRRNDPGSVFRVPYFGFRISIRREKELAAKKMARQKEKEDAIHGK